MAWEQCAVGKSDQDLADELNSAGSRTYRLIKDCKKKADTNVDPTLRRIWTKDSIFVLFKPESAQFYLGHTPYIGEKERAKPKHLRQLQIRQNTHQPIITQDLFERAMTARAKRRWPGRTTTPQSARIYLMGERIAHCAWCGSPMRCTNSKSGQEHLYYRCAAHLRGEPCEGSRLRVQEQSIAPQIEAYINAITLPGDWQDRVRALMAKDDQVQQLAKRRETLRSQLKRLNYQFEHGLIAEEDVADYEAKAQRLIKEINSLVAPNAQKTMVLGSRILELPNTWKKAPYSERHELLRDLFEAVYIDTPVKQIVGVVPFAEFVPLFKQMPLHEEQGIFMLKRRNRRTIHSAVRGLKRTRRDSRLRQT